MDEMMGVIKLFAGDYAPQGYMECNGQILPINQYQALFAILYGKFGGDGQTNFALPKMESPIEGIKYIICVQGMWPSRP
jgi:microcystin-dependent protein